MPDTLGLTIQSRLYADEGRTLDVWNKSAVEVTVTLTPSGDWQVTPTTMLLTPDEVGQVTVTEVGTAPGTLAVLATSTGDIPVGMQRSAVELTATLLQSRPFNPFPIIAIGTGLAALLLASILLAVACVVRRQRRARAEREWIEARLYGVRRHAHPVR